MTYTPAYYTPLPGGDDRSQGASWGKVLAAPFIWFFPAVVFTAIVSGFVGVIFVPAGALGSPLLAFFIVYAINLFLRIRRRQRARIVLGYVENAVRLNLPLDSFLLAAEVSETGAIRTGLRLLRQHLSAGASLGAALRFALPQFPEDQAAELIAAERFGRLAPVLTRIVRETRHAQPAARDDVAPLLRLYPLGIAGVTLLFFLFYELFVTPRFQEIFRDFRIALPPPTQFFMDISTYLDESYMGIFLLILVALAVAWLIGAQLQRLFTPAWPTLRLTTLYDWVAWHTPLWRGLQRDRGMARVCRVLAEGAQAGLPLTLSLDQAMAQPLNRHLRARVHGWRILLENGAPLSEAARKARLPSLFVGFLAAGSAPRASATSTSFAETFEFLARYYRHHLATLQSVLRIAVEPFVVLAVGSFVGLFVYSLLLPLVYLIRSVMPAPML